MVPGVLADCAVLAMVVTADDSVRAEAFALGGGVDVARMTIEILGPDCGLGDSTASDFATDRDFVADSLTTDALVVSLALFCVDGVCWAGAGFFAVGCASSPPTNTCWP